MVKKIIVASVWVFVGVVLGVYVSSRKAKRNPITYRLNEVFTLLESEYVDTVSLSKVADETIVDLLEKLDPHSSFIPASERVAASEELKGNFEGIGVEFNIFRDTLVVVTPLAGGPSEKAGILPGDKIVEVDGKKISGKSLNTRAVQRYLKGPKGSHVSISILRKSNRNLLHFELVRDKIPQHSLDAAYMVTATIGYIKINRFAQTTADEVHQAIQTLKAKGMKKLVLDLQSNPGGYLDQAIDIADEFLSDGKKIVFTKGKDTRYDEEAFATSEGLFEKNPLVILVNETSASASEIVSGAMQDHDRALIVGRRTFGKGLVQRPYQLSDQSEIRLTISRYYTPSGRCIQKPYKENEQYDLELSERLANGELFSQDSIKNKDTVSYRTDSGRKVFGGGGITPDVFVPLDTLRVASFFNALLASNGAREFAFQYSLKNKAAWLNKSFEQFHQTFSLTQADFASLEKTVEHAEKFSARVKEKSKPEINRYVKAEIARQIWGNEFFYRVYNEENDALRKAVELLESERYPLSPEKIKKQ